MRRKRNAVFAIILAILVAFTGTPVNAFASGRVKIPDFKAKTVYVRKGASKKLALSPKNKKAKLKWSTANKRIATVNKKGVVKGLKAGATKAAVKVAVPGNKVVTRKVKINVCDKITVTTGAAVSAIIRRNAYNEITIKTDETTSIAIPAGSYKNTSLIVDAPNADITNLGVFKSITINGIADDTWHEMAHGNTIVFNAPIGRVVVPAGAELRHLVLSSNETSLKLDIQGTVGTVDVNAASNVNMNVSGNVAQVNVNKKSEINIKGDTDKAISVNTSAEGVGSTISSEIKVDVTSTTGTKILLSKGAEGSTVKTDPEAQNVEVVNNTSTDISVTKSTGEKLSVPTGKTAETDTMTVKDTIVPSGNGSENTQPSASDNAASGSGASSSIPSGSGSFSGGSSNPSGGGTPSGDSGSSSGGGPSSGGETASGDASGDATASGDAKSSKTVITSVAKIKDILTPVQVQEDNKVTYPSLAELKKHLPDSVKGYYEKNGKKELCRVSLGEWENINGYPENDPKPGDYVFTAPIKVSKSYTVEDGLKASVIVKVEKPTITGFDPISQLKGGIEGTKLKSSEDLYKKLSNKSVYADVVYPDYWGNNGLTYRIRFNITSLNAPDNYKTDASESKAGDYKFAAVLDSSIDQFTIADGVNAVVPVHVTKNAEIEYSCVWNLDEKYKNFEVKDSYKIANDSKFVVFIQYNGTEDIIASPRIYYYNREGNTVDTLASKTSDIPFTNGRKIGFIFDLPDNGKVFFDKFDLQLLLTLPSANDVLVDNKDITVSDCGIKCYEYKDYNGGVLVDNPDQVSDKARCYIGSVELKNNSTATINNVNCIFYFWSKDGKLLDTSIAYNSGRIYGGYSQTIEEEYASPFDHSLNDRQWDKKYFYLIYGEEEIPDHVTVEINRITTLDD